MLLPCLCHSVHQHIFAPHTAGVGWQPAGQVGPDATARATAVQQLRLAPALRPAGLACCLVMQWTACGGWRSWGSRCQRSGGGSCLQSWPIGGSLCFAWGGFRRTAATCIAKPHTKPAFFRAVLLVCHLFSASEDLGPIPHMLLHPCPYLCECRVNMLGAPQVCNLLSAAGATGRTIPEALAADLSKVGFFLGPIF